MKKIMITGGTGFLGQAVVREFVNTGYLNLTPLSSKDGDLRDKQVANDLIKYHKPNIVIHLAAHVGGIGANMEKPGEFFYDNITMGVNLIDAAMRNKVEKFVQVGTVCSYPRITSIPFKEYDLWNGYPEETNAPYGIAKKTLLTMLQTYRMQYGFNGIYLIPTNLYGPGDNFDEKTSHVIPALINKFTKAKHFKEELVEIWGTGEASREFLYVEDCARAIRLATRSYNEAKPINIGSGEEISIMTLSNKIAELVGYTKNIIWNSNKPDGQPRRCLDTTRAHIWFGFRASTTLDFGLKQTVDWFYKEKFNADAIECVRN